MYQSALQAERLAHSFFDFSHAIELEDLRTGGEGHGLCGLMRSPDSPECASVTEAWIWSVIGSLPTSGLHE
jgi:hypothetical protein